MALPKPPSSARGPILCRLPYECVRASDARGRVAVTEDGQSAVIFLPNPLRGRLGDRMAETDAAHSSPIRSGSWTAEQVARSLVSRRDRLVTQLPREIAAARTLTPDQREL